MPRASYATEPATFQVRTLATWDAAPAPTAVLRALPQGCAPVLLHDSTGGSSLLAWSPDRRLEGRLAPPDARAGSAPLAARDPAAELEAAWSLERWSAADAGPGPGWIGWFGWACAHAYERFAWLPRAQPDLPDWSFARYRHALRFDGTGRAVLLGSDATDEAAPIREGTALLARAAARPAPADPAPALRADTGERFRSGVASLRAAIGRGELYQANLSHALRGAPCADPRAWYAATTLRQPTAMSAYWEDDAGHALLSHSPERFLAVRGAWLETRPIKGTAPRVGEAAADAAAAAALEASAKERAELAMIVDMARNDLGRVALPGAVQVPCAGEVEAYLSLFHRTATVRARWDPAVGFARLWAAVFPPASVSGAPKVAALRAIAALEEEDRGPYCGALGWWRPGPQPAGDFSVLIRTVSASAAGTCLRVGAGVTWDSTPEAEWAETLWKGRFAAAARGAD